MGRPMSDFMRRRHAVGFIGHKFGSNKFVDYVRRGQVLFDDIDVQLIDCQEQKSEFKRFAAFDSDTLGSDAVKYCAPPGEHDDFVASFLHVAPTLTISGRRDVFEPEPDPQPMVDENMMTTMDLWAEDLESPFDSLLNSDGDCMVF
jgi:hypothetical protein